MRALSLLLKIAVKTLLARALKIVGAYVSCPKDKSTEHKGFFIIDADSPPTVTKFFVRAKQLVTLYHSSNIAKKSSKKQNCYKKVV